MIYQMTILIAHNIRSTHNVGSLLRTCDGLGVDQVYLTGYTPYPKFPDDTRLPYLAEKIHKAINKTALGAEDYVNWQYAEDPIKIIAKLKSDEYEIVGLEQSPKSILIQDYKPAKKTALIIGEEVNGVAPDLLNLCDQIVEIPMKGQKESLNVSIATAIMLYRLTSL